jgi:hypothetical protein
MLVKTAPDLFFPRRFHLGGVFLGLVLETRDESPGEPGTLTLR